MCYLSAMISISLLHRKPWAWTTFIYAFRDFHFYTFTAASLARFYFCFYHTGENNLNSMWQVMDFLQDTHFFVLFHDPDCFLFFACSVKKFFLVFCTESSSSTHPLNIMFFKFMSLVFFSWKKGIFYCLIFSSYSLLKCYGLDAINLSSLLMPWDFPPNCLHHCCYPRGLTGLDKNKLKSKNWNRMEGMDPRKSGVFVQSDMGLIHESGLEKKLWLQIWVTVLCWHMPNCIMYSPLHSK